MRIIGQVMLFAFLVLNPVFAFSEDLGLVRLSLIEGDVQVLIKDSTDWTAAEVNLPLNEGDRIWVADNSKAEFQIRGGVYARMDGNTALDILTISPDSAQFYLDQGHVYINNRRGGIQTVQVDTPQSSLRSYDNSIMLIDVSEDNVIEVSMLKGDAVAESRTGATHVSAGNTLTIRGEDTADLAPISPPDDWEQWNIDRDRRLTAWATAPGICLTNFMNILPISTATDNGTMQATTAMSGLPRSLCRRGRLIPSAIGSGFTAITSGSPEIPGAGRLAITGAGSSLRPAAGAGSRRQPAPHTGVPGMWDGSSHRPMWRGCRSLRARFIMATVITAPGAGISPTSMSTQSWRTGPTLTPGRPTQSASHGETPLAPEDARQSGSMRTPLRKQDIVPGQPSTSSRPGKSHGCRSSWRPKEAIRGSIRFPSKNGCARQIGRTGRRCGRSGPLPRRRRS